MAFKKLMHAKDGVVAVIRALRPEDEVLIIAFSDSIDMLGEFGVDPPGALGAALAVFVSTSGSRMSAERVQADRPVGPSRIVFLLELERAAAEGAGVVTSCRRREATRRVVTA